MGPAVWAVLACVVAFVYLKWVRTKREYLTGTDSVFVSGDPYNVIVIHALATTKVPVALDTFRRTVEQHFACHRRFRQRVVKRVWRWHYFVDDESFSLDDHIVVHELPKGEAGEEETPAVLLDRLQMYISEQVQVPMDMSRAPWEFHFFPHHGTGSAYLLRVHHSLADGITLTRVAMRAFEAEAQGAAVEITSPGQNQSPSPSPDAALPRRKHSFTPQPSSQVGAGRVFAADTGFKALAKFKKPRPAGPKTLLSKLGAFFYQVGRVVLMLPDPVSRFKPAVGITPAIPCKARWLQHPLCLAEVKQLAYATGTSVNDVLFCVVASALRRFCLLEKRDPATLHDINSLMWVSLQGTNVSTEKINFGNRIGAIYVKLPMKEGDELKRLMQVRDHTSSLQVSPEPLVTCGLMASIGLIPWGFIRSFWRFLAFKASSSMSNVPGPQHEVSFAGAPVDDLVFFVPPQGTIASFLTIFSYAGGVQIGCLFDTRVVEDPQPIVELCVSEYTALKNRVAQLQKDGTLQQTLGLQEKDRAPH